MTNCGGKMYIFYLKNIQICMKINIFFSKKLSPNKPNSHNYKAKYNYLNVFCYFIFFFLADKWQKGKYNFYVPQIYLKFKKT